MNSGTEADLRQAEAFSPCNITGFFQIHSHDPDPLRVGSTGASVCLSDGVMTRVSLKKRARARVRATFNDHRLSSKSVSAHVAHRYLELDGGKWDIDVSHVSSLPVGRGYGTSGAGALSLSLALNDAIGLSFGKVEAGQIAHISEIACKTGLGTVSSVYSGGMTLRTAPGAPGVGKIEKISIPKSRRLVTTSFAPISTYRVLGSEELRNRVNSCAGDMVSKLRQNITQPTFMKFSRTFTQCLALMSRNLKRLMDRLDTLGVESSMAMLGQTLFCIAPRDDAISIANHIRNQRAKPIILEIANSGAHLR